MLTDACILHDMGRRGRERVRVREGGREMMGKARQGKGRESKGRDGTKKGGKL